MYPVPRKDTPRTPKKYTPYPFKVWGIRYKVRGTGYGVQCTLYSSWFVFLKRRPLFAACFLSTLLIFFDIFFLKTKDARIPSKGYVYLLLRSKEKYCVSCKGRHTTWYSLFCKKCLYFFLKKKYCCYSPFFAKCR